MESTENVNMSGDIKDPSSSLNFEDNRCLKQKSQHFKEEFITVCGNKQ